MNSIWDIINIPMGYVIRWCNALVGNQYLLALFLFAIVIEILLTPFGIKQQKNSIRQAKLKPKEMAIRKKYAGRDDKQTQQLVTQEIQEMYQRENFSPFSGCLPMLLQFPIIIALYNIVLNPLRYILQLSDTAIAQIGTIVKTFPEYADMTVQSSRTIDLMGAMKNLMQTYGSDVFQGVENFSTRVPDASALPNLTLFGGAIDLAGTPSFTSLSWLTLIPILTFLVYFFTMKLNRKFTYQPSTGNDQATGCSNNVMDVSMPLLSVAITFSVPAAIAVYWMFKSILGLLKQMILKKAMPFPVFTEEDYKAAEIEMGIRGKGKSGKNAAPATRTPGNGKPGSVRSLHHIDDEDFEDTRERALRAKAALEEAEKERNEKLGKKSPLSADAPAKMKDENDRHARVKEEKGPSQKNASQKNAPAKEEELRAEEPKDPAAGEDTGDK